jgi:hypothetical protein
MKALDVEGSVPIAADRSDVLLKLVIPCRWQKSSAKIRYATGYPSEQKAS